MTSQTEQFENLCDVEYLFHILLFIYKGIVKDILGTGAAIFEQPTYNAIRSMLEKNGIDFAKGENIKVALDNYARMLQGSGLVGEARFEKVGSNKYVLHIDKCIYAKRLHRCLKPFLKDQTCRYGLLATAIFQKFYGNKVKVAPSHYTQEGTQTTIQL
ncbi:MAG: hypothetical protein ACUVUF_08560 [Candidatus Bathycorpusculaceae bacterium]